METLRYEFVKVLEEERAIDTVDRYRDYLRATRDVRILLDIPRTVVPAEPSDPVRGAADAPVRIVEFSDFHCPFCRQARPVLERLMEKYAGQVQWTWKDYPLGPRAAAEAAACAHGQGRFWEYHDLLFERQGEIAPDDGAALLALARELGLDEADFAACVAEGRHQEDIASDAAAGAAAGVSGTPTVFVNGQVVAGVESFGALEQVVLDELRRIENRNGRE